MSGRESSIDKRYQVNQLIKIDLLSSVTLSIVQYGNVKDGAKLYSTDDIILPLRIGEDTEFTLGHNDNFAESVIDIPIVSVEESYFKNADIRSEIDFGLNLLEDVVHWICPQDYIFSDSLEMISYIESVSNYHRYHKVYDFEKVVVCSNLEELSVIEDNVLVRCRPYELSDIIVVRKEILSYDKKTL